MAVEAFKNKILDGLNEAQKQKVLKYDGLPDLLIEEYIQRLNAIGKPDNEEKKKAYKREIQNLVKIIEIKTGKGEDPKKPHLTLENSQIISQIVNNLVSDRGLNRDNLDISSTNTLFSPDQMTSCKKVMQKLTDQKLLEDENVKKNVENILIKISAQYITKPLKPDLSELHNSLVHAAATKNKDIQNPYKSFQKITDIIQKAKLLRDPNYQDLWKEEVQDVAKEFKDAKKPDNPLQDRVAQIASKAKEALSSKISTFVATDAPNIAQIASKARSKIVTFVATDAPNVAQKMLDKVKNKFVVAKGDAKGANIMVNNVKNTKKGGPEL